MAQAHLCLHTERREADLLPAAAVEIGLALMVVARVVEDVIAHKVVEEDTDRDPERGVLALLGGLLPTILVDTYDRLLLPLTTVLLGRVRNLRGLRGPKMHQILNGISLWVAR